MKTENKVVSASVYCVGVKVRCRKTDRHFLEVGDFSLDTDIGEIIAKAVSMTKKEMKQIKTDRPVLLRLNDVTVTVEGVWTSRSFMLCSDKKIDITHHFVS